MSQSGRRIRHRAPLSQAEIELGMTLVSAFLHPMTDLDTLRTCSRAMKEVATADAVWSAHTRRVYPWAVHLRRSVGGASAFTGRNEYVRMESISLRAVLRKPVREIPGVDAYSALVIVKLKGDIIVDGLFDMVPNEQGPAVVNVAPAGSLLEHRIQQDNLFSEVAISVVLVRKADGKAIELFDKAKAEREGWEEEDGPVEYIDVPFDDSFQDPDTDFGFQLMMTAMSWAERDELPWNPSLTGWRSLEIQSYDSRTRVRSILEAWDRSKLWV